jgi:hypothetical protein
MSETLLIIGPFGAGQLPLSFARAFESLDHVVVRYDSDVAYLQRTGVARHRLVRRLLRRQLWNAMNREVLDLVTRVRPDAVFAIKGTFLHPRTIAIIRDRLAVPIANYYSDNPYCGVPWNPRKSSAQRRDLVAALREYTRVWIWDRGMAARLEADGVRSAYLPFGVDPEVFRPLRAADCDHCKRRHDVVFIGQHSDKRQAHLAAVRRPVAIWGSRWARAESVIADRHHIHQEGRFGEACARAYATASVSLNIVDDLNMPGHNMRTFEIPASGGLMLATYTREQAEMFPPGEAALYYDRPEDIDRILDDVLRDPARLERMRQTALALSSRHHYRERARTIARAFWPEAGR